MTAMAIIGTISISEFSALKFGSHAGTGAPAGMPRIESEKDQRPEREQRVVISLQRTTGEFRQEIKCRAEADEARPQKNQIVAKPPAMTACTTPRTGQPTMKILAVE